MPFSTGKSEYAALMARKAAAVAAHDERKFAHRKRIVDEILRNPARAISMAHEAIANKNAEWQQWSNKAWKELLSTRPPQELADLLLHPQGHQESLADSHPFSGLLPDTHGRRNH